MRLIDLDAIPENAYWCRDALAEALADAPVIEERKTGTWCLTPDGKLVCSNCYNNPTNRIIVDGSLIYDMTPIRERMKYCPNCGSYNVGGEP